MKDYVSVFAALANEHRLAVFRLLMPAGPTGMPAGQIAVSLKLAPSTLSTHLAQMCSAGLLRSTRQQRQIIYAVDIEGTRDLLSFLTDDCCQGRPEICGYTPLTDCKPEKRNIQVAETSDE